MGALNAEFRSRESDWGGYRSGGGIQRRLDIVLCDIGPPDARENEQVRRQAGRDREGQGRADQDARRTLGDALKGFWRGSCMAVNHRLCEAEARAEKLAKSFGIDGRGK